MVRRQSLHPIDRKGQLGVDRFLDPKRAVVIKDGDPLLAGTSSALPGVVTSVTNSTIAPFNVPTFQEDSGSAAVERDGKR